MSVVTRRGFLKVGLLVASSSFAAVSCQQDLPTAFLQRLSAELGIGKTYLGTLAKKEIDGFSLERDITILERMFRSAAPEKYASHYFSLITSDFQQSRIVKVSGWLMSITEARVLALFCEVLPNDH